MSMVWVLLALALLPVLVWAAVRGSRRRHRTSPAATLVVFGSGGHTAEMLSLLQSLPPERYAPITYIAADTDTTSESRAKAANVIPKDATLLRIPRSREVGQSYVSAVWSTLKSFGATISMVARIKPDLLLVNGPGTCLPVCAAARALNWLDLLDARIVFVESVCRVTSLSLTGKILYALRLADQIQVQWHELKQRYPRTVYVGMLL